MLQLSQHLHHTLWLTLDHHFPPHGHLFLFQPAHPPQPTTPTTTTRSSAHPRLSTPSTYRSQSRTEGSHREETRKTTPSGPSTSAYSDGQRTSSFSCLS
jgi:hypothetical protein